EKIRNNCEIKFIDVNDINGQSMYLAALKYIFVVAVKELYGKDADVGFLNSLDKGLYAKLNIGEDLTLEVINKITDKMQEIIDMDLLFEKITAHKKEAINFLLRNNETEKAKNIQNLSNSTVVLFKLKTYYNYFYTDLPYSTKAINKFKLDLDDSNHLLLRFPTARSNNEIPGYKKYNKTLESFRNYRSWLNNLNIDYVADLNDVISDNKIKQFIQMNEIYLDNELEEISGDIAFRNKIKIVLMAGPSSSGKTTSAHKLSLYLKSHGIDSIIISVDNYFKEKEECQKDGEEINFESPDKIDIDLLNKQISSLLKGEDVSLPKFNFFTGKKEYKGNIVSLKEKDLVILEGLHCLNNIITPNVPSEYKYKIYVSPFMPLRIDRHNHISTTDLRLVRRIVRDSVFRGYSVSDTISGWQSVRCGEEKYIFPYQENVDVVLNTAAIYELGILKVYAEPLLYSVPIASPYYEEARRLLGHLRIYFPITSEYVAKDSILREFIGGSGFNPH
ncbi:MAG TPA: hypothetical protein PLX66_00760, partial [Bacilli bacterium]|nr:hypothetical protein [Bacilli bacterium]